MRLHDHDSEHRLIYAPRDEDGYIKRADITDTVAIAVDRRLSKERGLIRRLADELRRQKREDDNELDCDDRKQMLYDKLRKRHRDTMQRIITDLNVGLASSA